MKIKLWYIGLESVELNLARVKARVEQGGHNIAEADIRRRWDSSRRNLIKLLPYIHSLRLYDNSHEADPNTGKQPKPRLLFHLDARMIVGPAVANAPEWAKPIIAGILNNFEQGE